MAFRPYSSDLQKTFRDTLGTPGAPEVVDDQQPVTAVAVVAGNLTATLGSGTITTTPSKFTATVIASTRAGAGSTTVGTVGAGKVWRILAAWCTCRDAVSSDTSIQLNGVVVVGCGSASTTGCANSVKFDYAACPVLTAGQTVVLNNSAANTGAGGVTYVEETA